MTRKALVFALAASAAVVPVADAHTLSKAKAKTAARAATAGLVSDLGGSPAFKCSRVGVHKVDCQVSLVTVDGSVCVTNVRVAYRNHQTRAAATRIVSGPDCEPPELPTLPGV